MKAEWSVPGALRTVRKRQGLTQAQVAERMGLTTAAYQHYEGGRSEPRMGDVKALADAMQVSPCDFFEDAPREQSPSYTPTVGDEMGKDLLDVMRGMSPKRATLLLGMLKLMEEAEIE